MDGNYREKRGLFLNRRSDVADPKLALPGNREVIMKKV